MWEKAEKKGRKARALFLFSSRRSLPSHQPRRLLSRTKKKNTLTEAEVAELRAELSPPPPSTSSSSPSSSSGTTTITLRYSTGWQEAYCHLSRDGRSWTTAPGVKLAAAPADAPNPGDRELRIEGARRLDFVMTDGHGNWDTPVPSYSAHGGNGHGSGSDSDGGGGKASPSFYSIEEPGTWRLKSGKLTKQ